MTALRRHRQPIGVPLTLSLAVVLVLATFGGFGTAFGVMQACTDTYSCTVTECVPCTTAAAWVEVGWAVQGVLLLIGLITAVLARRGVAIRAVGRAGWLLGPASIALLIATTSLARSSF